MSFSTLILLWTIGDQNCVRLAFNSPSHTQKTHLGKLCLIYCCAYGAPRGTLSLVPSDARKATKPYHDIKCKQGDNRAGCNSSCIAVFVSLSPTRDIIELPQQALSLSSEAQKASWNHWTNKCLKENKNVLSWSGPLVGIWALAASYYS